MELARRVSSSDFIRITAQSSVATPFEPAPFFGMHLATLPRLTSLAQRTRSPSKSHRGIRSWAAITSDFAASGGGTMHGYVYQNGTYESFSVPGTMHNGIARHGRIIVGVWFPTPTEF